MAPDVERRKLLALDAIRQAFGVKTGGDSVNLFVEHHLEELLSSYLAAAPRPLRYRTSGHSWLCSFSDFWTNG